VVRLELITEGSFPEVNVIMANEPDYSATRWVLAEYSLKEIMGLIKTGQLLPASVFDFPIIAYYQDGTPVHLEIFDSRTITKLIQRKALQPAAPT